ncbi:photosystem II protein Psb27 [Moorena producens JHB]|uniref:Photosystem II lipoprotein Psb27 n=1 Tax=Moorena producens (strain JHB) TaxID=1454205 RepID=A0A1D9GB54_MOOP1|nr:photosystem II protein Psb27 [Moorena producens]AOY84705.2 photosystem II protein Psb27 [Moorena producens JHB]
MLIKRYLSGFIALVLVMVIGLTGCGSSVTGLTGDYRQDTLTALQELRQALELPEDSPDKAAIREQASLLMNDYNSRYRRDRSVSTLNSFTTMRTAVNSLAGYYSSYPNRPLPKKLKDRLEQEFSQVERALKRGA